LLKILKDRQHPVTIYCLKRGLAETAILNFQIGYAPKDNFLLALAKKHQLNLDLLVAIGVLKLSTDQQTYKDKFVDRLMIPIKDQAGRVVGFTGRVLDYDTTDRPKYLNSPQTQWFNKSQIWFGWDLARKAIVQNRTAILVEGNLDVITAHSFGLTNTIASQGTSFTELQLKFLKNYAQTLWLAFDNDDAGQIAGQKLFIQATKFGFQTKKLIIPKPYKDLDEYLRAEFGQTISNQILLDKLSVIDFLDWKIEQMSDQLTNTNLSRQRQATWEILELLAYTDPLSVEQYIRKLSQLTNFSQSTLLAEVNNLKNNFDLKPQSLRAEESENLGAKDIARQIIQAWQMLCSYFLHTKNQTLIDQQFLTSLFSLLHKFVDALSDYPTLEAYLQANQANLELIWEYKHQAITTDLIVQITKSLLFYLDQKIGLLKLNTDELLMYSEIKKRLQNQ
jgi:DNA primase